MIFPTKFRVSWHSVQGKKFTIDFQDGGRFGFPIGMILLVFVLQIAPILPTKFRINDLSIQEKKLKKDFLRRRP